MPENRRRFRNPVARSPLLRKGGVHTTSRSGIRHNQRQALEAELDNWREEIEETDWQSEEPVPKGTDSSLSSHPVIPFQQKAATHILASLEQR